MTGIIIAIFDSWFQWSMAILHHNNLGALFHDPIHVISGTLSTVVNFICDHLTIHFYLFDII